MHVCMYIYACLCVCVCVYLWIFMYALMIMVSISKLQNVINSKYIYGFTLSSQKSSISGLDKVRSESNPL